MCRDKTASKIFFSLHLFHLPQLDFALLYETTIAHLPMIQDTNAMAGVWVPWRRAGK
jgi:hypothetical protein